MNKPKRRLSQRLKDRYRLIIFNDNTFEEIGYLKLKGVNLLWTIAIVGVLLVGLTYMLIAYTSVRELIPGYPDSKLRREIVMNALRLDSLQRELVIRDRYFQNIRNVLNGREPIDYTSEQKEIKPQNVSFKKSENDSLLRKQIEEEEQFNLSIKSNTEKGSTTDLSRIHFFTPIRGVVTNPYNATTNHFGTDIVAGPNEVIKTVLDGTVINAGWTLETGYVIEIQHDNSLISIYRHNAELLKNIGTHVEAGEPIAIVGNSGELTSGPHLHFELWYNGRSINPQDYIVF